jgi:hypothetical protein
MIENAFSVRISVNDMHVFYLGSGGGIAFGNKEIVTFKIIWITNSYI